MIIVLFFIAGLGLAWILSHMVGAQIAFLRTARSAEGRVVALKESIGGSKNQSLVYAPVFHYTTADGRPEEAVGDDASNPPMWTIGQTGELLYDPGAPSHVVVDTLWGRWGSLFVLAIVTLSFFAGGTLGLRTRGWRF